MIDDTEQHFVKAVKRDEEIVPGVSLANSGQGEVGLNGATYKNESWIATDPVKPGLVDNPDFDPTKYIGVTNREMIPGLVSNESFVQGLNVLHEVIGHQYENLINSSTTPMDRNLKNACTTKFETMVRQIYVIGRYSWLGAFIRSGISKGDPYYLGGSGEPHALVK